MLIALLLFFCFKPCQTTDCGDPRIPRPSEWWNADSQQIFTYDQSSIRFFAPSGGTLETWICSDSVQTYQHYIPATVYVKYDEKFPENKYCQKEFVVDENILFFTTNYGQDKDPNLTAAKCLALLPYTFMDIYVVLIKEPIEENIKLKGHCPFNPGNYQVIVTRSSWDYYCEDDSTSTAVVTDKEITINACKEAGNSSRLNPVRETFICASNAKYPIFRYVPREGLVILGAKGKPQDFYCAHYLTDTTASYLSLYFQETSRQINCPTNPHVEIPGRAPERTKTYWGDLKWDHMTFTLKGNAQASGRRPGK